MLAEFVVNKMYQLVKDVKVKVLSCTRYFMHLVAGMNRADLIETSISLFIQRIFSQVIRETNLFKTTLKGYLNSGSLLFSETEVTI